MKLYFSESVDLNMLIDASKNDINQKQLVNCKFIDLNVILI